MILNFVVAALYVHCTHDELQSCRTMAITTRFFGGLANHYVVISRLTMRCSNLIPQKPNTLSIFTSDRSPSSSGSHETFTFAAGPAYHTVLDLARAGLGGTDV
jgi:hypothetical protein